MQIKNHSIDEGRLWKSASILGFFVFMISSFYLMYEYGVYDLNVANRSLSYTSIILIGLSYALSGICYFWNRFDSKIIYRKYFGLVGFIYSLLHVIVTMFFLSFEFPFPSFYLAYPNILPFIFAVLAFIVLSMMAIISNKFAVQHIGGKRWKKLLQMGYIAYIFILFHFGLKKYTVWISWMKGEVGILPPYSFFIFLYMFGVLLLRLAVSIHTNKKRTRLNYTPLPKKFTQ